MRNRVRGLQTQDTSVLSQRSARIRDECLEDLIGGLVPDEWAGFSFQSVIQLRIEATSSLVERWMPRRSQRSLSRILFGPPTP